ncbi:hypothetical protein SAMN02910377_01583 [Pseudobutyrivibrio ruminis]|uniref:Uncharacterized protein n=1 Tax=Pseudobutyrivibrio ruminis TaxID=46206 RepID=A0A1H7J3T4_9FIRM|nr:hypothetical protein [Pseudobutyrivibrio ruminis]SEK69246.1 hypothetical protein SAMN02910377_01583 [Pseudobutyrivibrio ruminis]
MKKYKIAAIIMIIHGGFMELAGVLCMIPALLLGNDKFDIGKFFEFKLQYFQDNICIITITLMMFLFPAGIMDGILAGSALILILMGFYGDRKITNDL